MSIENSLNSNKYYRDVGFRKVGPTVMDETREKGVNLAANR